MPLYDKEYHFYGYHRDCINSLRANRIFKSAVEIFYIAPIIGFLNHYRVLEEKDESSIATDIQSDQFYKNDTQITFAFQCIMLCDEDFEPNETKRINALFRDTTTNPKYLKRFEEYVRGGIEILYKNLIEDVSGDEKLIAARLYDFTNQIDTFQSSIKADRVTEACQTFIEAETKVKVEARKK